MRAAAQKGQKEESDRQTKAHPEWLSRRAERFELKGDLSESVDCKREVLRACIGAEFSRVFILLHVVSGL